MTMSYVWCFLLFVSIAYSIFAGTAPQTGSAALSGAQSGVTLAISLAGVLCLWSGLSRVMEKSGLAAKLASLLRPLLTRLFPDSARDAAALQNLSGNFTANLLGLGSAATPLGMAAVRRMQTLSGSPDASDEMCRLIVLNTASVQLIPSTVAAVRASLGAPRAFEILPAVWLTSLCSVTAGLFAAKLFSRWWRT